MKNKASLTTPGRIGTMELRNRMFQTAMGPSLAEDDFTSGDRVAAFYEARAKGGAALVVVGAMGVGVPEGQIMEKQVAISDDRFIPGLRNLTEAVQSHGAKIAAQLQHGGPGAIEDTIAGKPLWTPSLPSGSSTVLTDVLFEEEFAKSSLSRVTSPAEYRVMDKADIRHVVQQFAEAARRAVEAGFDGIEIHGAHGFLVSSFLSPAMNTRTDEYGGSVENRARILTDILTAVREEIGRDFPVWSKFHAIEFNLENGLTVEDACEIARLAEKAGADAITASALSGRSRGKGLVSGSAPMRPASYAPYAAQVKEAVNIPVISAGRLEIAVANEFLGDGKLDFIGMGRKLLADPELPNKVMAGTPEDIRPCIYCYLCLTQSALDLPIRCAANGVTGREHFIDFPETDNPRRVVVVGGGPGGMETARLLDKMGHSVTLLEASDQLGGTARIAAIAYEPNGRLVEWLKRQLDRSSVDVRLSTRADVDTIRSLNADAVVVATGALRIRPEIEGSDLPHVYDGNDLRQLLTGESAGPSEKSKFSAASRFMMGAGRVLGLTDSPEMARRASHLWMPIGTGVVIIGGDLVGLELAEFLVHRGRNVTVIDDTDKFGKGLPALRRAAVLDELQSDGVELVKSAREISIGKPDVTCLDAEGQPRSFKADNVILAKGATANLSLADDLRAAGIETHVVGDCKGVGYIAEAMTDAATLAASMR